MLELAVALGVVCLLLAMLLPMLASARTEAHRAQSAANLRGLHGAWAGYLELNEGRFPFVPLIDAGWKYGGVRFSTIDDRPFLDPNRPLNPLLAGLPDAPALFRSPADKGIGGPTGDVGTGGRTAFRAFGTSYRANHYLLDAGRTALSDVSRPLAQAEIMTAPSRLVVMGEPLWWEVYAETGRDADWYADDGLRANVLYHDGSVRYSHLRPRTQAGPAVVVPIPRPRFEGLDDPRVPAAPLSDGSASSADAADNASTETSAGEDGG